MKSQVLLLLTFISTTGEWTVLLFVFGMIHRRSCKLLSNWKYGHWVNRKDHLIMKKYRKSSKLLALKCGGFYVFTLKRAIAFINFILWGAAKVVIVTKTVSEFF